MTSAKTPPPAGSAPNARLNGWKEIAAHFGRGVRTVQRWEKAFGMPVHRIGSGRGENVHALAGELDAWLVTAERFSDLSEKPGDADGAETTATPGPGGVLPQTNDASEGAAGRPGPADVAGGRSRPRVLIVLPVAVALILGVLALWHWRTVPQPSSVKADGDTLRAFDADQHLLWSHTFDRPFPSIEAPASSSGRFAICEDINGDGSREVCVLAPDSHPNYFTQLVCFSAAGDLLWTHRPRRTVRFGVHDYSPPWAGHFLFVTGEGKNRALWVSWIHMESGEFPSLLERMSGTGQSMSEYWSAGYIDFVGALTVGARASIVVGGPNNDHGGASLAVLDAASVQGSSPAESPDKVCRNCPAGSPRHFLVFPALELKKMVPGFPSVMDVRGQDDGELRVWVDQSGPEGPNATAIYRLGADLQPASVEISSEYKALHRTLEEKKRLDHPFGDQDYTQAWPVLFWTQDRKVFVPVKGVTDR